MIWRLLPLLTLFVVASCGPTYQADFPKPISPTTVGVIDDEDFSGDEGCKTGLQAGLRSHGFTVVDPEVGSQNSTKLIVKYQDTWMWDVVMYLRKLNVTFLDAKTGKVKGKAFYKNSYPHGFVPSSKVAEQLIEIAGEQGAFAQ